MTTETLQPLIPENVRPAPCRRLRCLMTLRQVAFDTDPSVAVFLVHGHHGQHDTFPIPTKWLDDVDKDIWAEITPWLVSLHEDSPRPEVSLGLD